MLHWTLLPLPLVCSGIWDISRLSFSFGICGGICEINTTFTTEQQSAVLRYSDRKPLGSKVPLEGGLGRPESTTLVIVINARR